ncbi:hypothetical protein [Halorubellus sp. PRR65]|uniref:hypothetical protein n=1 Tax=Halorubellus sp. PRR65 TaxID=3098148 RepID=UPI002B25B962|nr:hypothetical protein [Halorubellus sp. PRR65]
MSNEGEYADRTVVGDPVDLTVADLEAAGLGSQLATIEDAVADHLDGSVANVAVVAEPYAGRDVLLEYAEEQLGAAAGHVAFDELVTDFAAVDVPNREVVVVEGCHHLYARRIGGFDALNAFLDHIAASDALFVTAWNRWAWDYLAAVQDLDRAFPVHVHVPRLDPESVSALVREHVDDLPAFVESDDHGRVKTVDFDRATVDVAGRELSVPVPELNVEYLTARDMGEEYGETERVVYERLARLAEGNPGVALALWDRSVRDGELSPTDLEEPEAALDLDDDEAMTLTTVLCNETLSMRSLREILPDVDVAQAVQTLDHQELVELERDARPRSGDDAEAESEPLADGDGTGSVDERADVLSVAPERFHAAVEHLEGRRLLW